MSRPVSIASRPFVRRPARARTYGRLLARPAAGAAMIALDLGATGAVAGLDALGPARDQVLLAGCLMVAMRIVAGLYPGFGLHPEALLRGRVLTWAAAGLTATAAQATVGGGLAQGGSLGMAWAAFVLLALLSSAATLVLRLTLTSLGAWGRPVAIAGDPARSAALAAFLRQRREFGLRPALPGEPTPTLLWAAHGMPDPETLARLREGRREVILVSDLPRLRLSGVHPAEHGDSIGLRLSPRRPGKAAAVLKRTTDLALALPMAIFSLPVVLLSALAIRAADRGPAFYVQTREGRHGHPIGILKLRTMFMDAEAMLAAILARDPAARAEWQAHFKLRRDPRILPGIGRALRTSSLDELPQLLNVIRGEMSLVGPRPFPAYHLDAMPGDFRRRRHAVTPGLTGLWQISERSEGDTTAQRELDDYYLAGRGFWGDISILLRTVTSVLGRAGAF